MVVVSQLRLLKESKYPEATKTIQSSLEKEISLGLESTQVFMDLKADMEAHRANLIELLVSLKAAGKKVMGYGASTKGNVLIQYCGLTSDLVSCIAEVNPDKFGAYTPGSKIPIISEADARAMKPDYYIVFPWHFRENIIQREQAFLQSGGKFIFPLPHLEIVSSEGKQDIDSIILSSVA